MDRSAKYLKSLVGAPRFELGTSCAQGRRATRLRYAPTVTALFILKHFPTLLLIRVVIFGLTVPNTFTESWLCQNPVASHWLGGSFSLRPLASSVISSANTS